METIKAWHFAAENNRLNYGDDREIVIGETHTISTDDRSLELCKWGLHGSRKIIDALNYAPGPIIYRVELSGQIIYGEDKIVATERTYISGFDATDILRKFARQCAIDVLHLWDAPEIVIEYLNTGNEDIRAAAWAAALDAALDAASDAASEAASAAALDAASDAASEAAWATARATARVAVRDAQNKKLEKMVLEVMNND